MNVRQKEFHRAAFGNLPGFVQVALRAIGADVRASQASQPGAGEEGERKILLLASGARHNRMRPYHRPIPSGQTPETSIQPPQPTPPSGGITSSPGVSLG